MLTKKAHRMFVGESGISRIINRTCQVMNEFGIDDPVQIRVTGMIDLPTTPRHLNAHFSVTIDPFDTHQPSNAATYDSAGLKERDEATKRDDNQVLQGGRSKTGEATASVIDLLRGDTHIYICGLKKGKPVSRTPCTSSAPVPAEAGRQVDR